MIIERKNRGIELKGESLDKLLELKKLHKDKNIFEHNDCLCGTNDDELIAKEDRYGLECNFVICKNCGLVRMNPYYTEDFLKIFYSKFYSPIYRGSSKCSEEKFNERILYGNSIIENIEKIIGDISNKRIFEIGCGSGGILQAFKLKGNDVYGVDYGKEYLEFAKIKGLNVVEGDFNELEKFGQCDILILNHLLEHITKPINFLKNIRKLLKEDGYLYVEVPVLETIPNNYNYDIFTYFQSAHIFNFSNDIFKNIILASGYGTINEINENSLICRKSIYNSQPYIKNNYGYINSVNYINLVENSYNILNIIRNTSQPINKKLEKLIDTLAWWIPVRKWRDNFRNKFFDKFIGRGVSNGFKFTYPINFRLNLKEQGINRLEHTCNRKAA